MKKVINHKLYNTDTAELLGEYSFGKGYSDVNYFYEALYRTKSGAYFIHGEGGARTEYATLVSSNSWTGGENIIPISEMEAYEWAEEHDMIGVIEKYFSDQIKEA